MMLGISSMRHRRDRRKCFLVLCIVALLVTRIVVVTASSCTDGDIAIAADVVIVGAGIAGISAYRELKKQQPNLNVVILEATKRVGGRMRKGTVGGYTIEKGAAWLHSTGTAFR
jgi:ribulose 1,5-bisphosphate synthetase/thiazole synthase